ncbi:polysaccharide biosynthesis/export family protein [Olivibacter sp. SA151]|uniref:polysaccharide biosynthesis/export family protein n=1 Tax=Olivibacter jilunii TaxID=985016 RepID=UPI003F14D5A0
MRKFLGFLALVLLVFPSCQQKRNLVYFSDLEDSAAIRDMIPRVAEPKIQTGDILAITVNTLNPESNLLFNNGTLQNLSERNVETTPNQGYLVNPDGAINFPVIGKISLVGRTKEEASELLVSKLSEYVKDPIVNIRFSNFRITVVGEVNKPSTFVIPNDRINLIEALGLAGDMTPYGKRENILLIREENGKRTMVRLNLNKKETMQSDFFYLKQNDMLYVEPDKMKEKQTRTDIRTITLISSLASLAIVAISRL